MKDLESPEHRAMEREILHAARERERLGNRDHTHISIAITLFVIAIVLYSVGFAGAAAFVLLGVVAETMAWVLLLGGPRRPRH